MSKKPRDVKTNNELRLEICDRSYADLYMDIFEIVKPVPRADLLKILEGMDLDDREGRKGSLRTRFPWNRLRFPPGEDRGGPTGDQGPETD